MRWLPTLAMVVLGTACGAGALPAAKTAPGGGAHTAPVGLVYVGGGADPTIRVIHAPTGRLQRTLPAATPSPGWRWLYHVSAGALDVIDPITGATAASHPAPGWARAVATSANGAWLALSDPGAGRFQVQDAGFSLPPVTVSLGRRFTFDGLSGDGRRLYLLEWVSPARYQVRRYDLATGALSPQVISEKGEVPQLMSGDALAGYPTRDGAMQLTLYQRDANGRAFVHALPLTPDVPFAFCVDLPGPGDGWGFVPGPDGRHFYGVNPTAGLVVELSTSSDIGPPSVRHAAIDAAGPPPVDLPPAAVVSPDGSTLYVALGKGLAAVDTLTLKERMRSLTGEPLAGLSMASDGSVLYAMTTPGLLRIDPRTLSVTGTIPLAEPASAILHAS